jgi:hypothetical protein
MHPTRVRDLISIAVVAGVISWVVVRAIYGDLPRLHWFLPLSLPVLAVAEAVAGFQLRARIHRRPRTKPVEPIVAARTVALAKASAIVGAVMTGVWAGVLGYVVPLRSTVAAAQGDTVAGIIGAAGAIVLVAAALWLEYCCRTPDPPEDDRSRSDAQRDEQT